MDYDLIVIGGGTGNKVASYASKKGNKTALIEPGPVGGTCLNRGCNPSKMLIHHAEIIDVIRDAERFHIDAEITGLDFKGITKEVEETVTEEAKRKAERLRSDPNLDLYKSETEFVDDRVINVDDERVHAEKFVVAAGSRPVVPSAIDGLQDVDYLTSSEALFLEDRPENLIILGGGYIAAELGYFFDLMGTEVSMIEMEETLLPREDCEVSEAFTEIASERHTVLTGHRVTSVSQSGSEFMVQAIDKDENPLELSGDSVLVALGRRPNSDTLNLEATGVETNERGFIKTNEFLETTNRNVWAIGDVADNYMFKHSADYEAKIVMLNVVDGRREKADFSGMSHVVFTNPQVAGVGKREEDLDEDTDYEVGYAYFKDTTRARAEKFKHGFVKVLLDKDSGEILGCWIIGHEASVLIHEITLAVRSGLKGSDIADTIHVHPTLSKIIEKAFNDLQSV